MVDIAIINVDPLEVPSLAERTVTESFKEETAAYQGKAIPGRRARRN